jgi:FixJ family two-component response regulator
MVAESEPTVHIVDDDPSVRDALERLIRSMGLRARTYGSANEFLEGGPPAGPGCVVVDVRMPGMSGLELQEELAAYEGGLPVVFITGHGTIPMSVRAMKFGAIDFLTKPFDDQDLLDAVHRAIEKDGEIRTKLQDLEGVRRRVALLTPREREVFERVVAGRLNREIAEDLGASVKTIKVHRSRVMRKMQAASLAHLVRLAETWKTGERTADQDRS